MGLTKRAFCLPELELRELAWAGTTPEGQVLDIRNSHRAEWDVGIHDKKLPHGLRRVTRKNVRMGHNFGP